MQPFGVNKQIHVGSKSYFGLWRKRHVTWRRFYCL